MRRRILITALSAAALLSCSHQERRHDGMFLDQLQERDSVLIGDQLSYGFTLDAVEEGTELILPEWGDDYIPGVELVGQWTLDTLQVHKGRKGAPSKLDLEGSVTVTSFDEGHYELPPIEVVLRYSDGVVDTREFDGTSIDVTTMPVDTASFVVHELKGQMRYPVTFREVLPWFLGGLAVSALIAGLIVLIVVTVRRRRKAQSGPAEPAHIVALRKLDALRGQEHWAPERQKEFWSSVTDILREYISARYGISAPEMTSREIMDSLSELSLEPELSEALDKLFSTADFVKFAKHTAPQEDNASAVPLAVKFVTDTYREEIEKDKETK